MSKGYLPANLALRNVGTVPPSAAERLK
jgi:hypothetical protein